MKPIQAYEDMTGKVHRYKSDAISADTKALLHQLADKLNKNASENYVIGTFQEALLKNISPRRLMRMYAKIWNLKKQYDQAIEEEKIKEDLPF